MRILVFVLLSGFATLAWSSDEAMARFNQLMANDTLREQAYTAAVDRVRFCSYCHGENGNSKRDYIPNLAAQSPVYLFKAFEAFATGERTDFVMNKLAETLSIEEQVNIAVYFSQQKVVPSVASVDPTLRQQGEELFKKTCTGCHGAQGEGKENMPRLAGQPGEYVRRALTRFHDNDPRRANSVMRPIAGQLYQKDIEALAAYLEKLAI